MPGIGGLSVANDLLANDAQLNLNRNAHLLEKSVSHLSSGLRITSAADDPSGLAISESLLAQVYGFDQGTRNVQDAANAANVAEGALQTATDILQRIRSLAVESSTDATSLLDRAHLQTEVTQLLGEIDRLTENTAFNGAALLDGSHAGFREEIAALVDVTANAVLNSATFATANTIVASVTYGATNTAIADGTIEVQVAQVTATQQGVAVSFYDAAALAVTSAAVLTVTNGIVGTNGLYTVDAIQLGFNAGIGTADVGSAAYLRANAYVSAVQNQTAPAFVFQSGALEGEAIELSIAQTSTASLRISNVNLIATADTLSSEDAIGAIDHAVAVLTGQRARLGAAIVRLQEERDDNVVASNNLQASESAIRDVDVAHETTDYTRAQIIGALGASVLAQSQSDASLVLGLFPGTSAAKSAAPATTPAPPRPTSAKS